MEHVEPDNGGRNGNQCRNRGLPGRLNRRTFLKWAVLPAIAAALPLSGCRVSTMSPEPVAPGDGRLPLTAADKQGLVFDNHEHTAFLAKRDIEAGAAFTLHIQGKAYHDHVLELTEAEMADIRAGLEFAKRSSNDWGHTHEVMFNRIEHRE